MSKAQIDRGVIENPYSIPVAAGHYPPYPPHLSNRNGGKLLVVSELQLRGGQGGKGGSRGKKSAEMGGGRNAGKLALRHQKHSLYLPTPLSLSLSLFPLFYPGLVGG